MKVSVITPTADRAHFLHGLHHLLNQQTYSNWEWLIYDTSLAPLHFSDPRIRYFYDPGIVSIGEKRNRLIEKATGDAIVHCDDDDYYAPNYFEFVCRKLKTVDFFNLHSWFSYDLKTRQVYYWATDVALKSQYVVNAIMGSKIREIEIGSFSKLNTKGRTGFGFSYAYQKKIMGTCRFPDCDFGEDRPFYEAVEKAGFSIAMEADHQGRAIHVIHDMNTSTEYPQYRIPHFLVEQLFPGFFSHIESFHEN